MTHGLPPSLTTDGWWLDDPASPSASLSASPSASPQDTPPRLPPRLPRARTKARGPAPRTVGLLALVALGDLLFWQHRPGLSLAVFALAIFVTATVDIRPRRRLLRPAALLIVFTLPVIEYVQALSVGFLATGLAIALVWARLGEPAPWRAVWYRTALAWLARLPKRAIGPLTPAVWRAGVQQAAAAGQLRQSLRDWAFPLGGMLVLGALILNANPLLAATLRLEADPLAILRRVLFWGGLALLLWPLLDRDLPTPPPANARPLPPLGAWLGIHRASVLRALVTFNALVAVQTVTDIRILLGGADLPPGMSYAEYAHRGAYPLLATALLAGAFALAARPFLEEHRAIRPLVLLWLAQNIGICLAAMLRLDTYIDAYGFTYLRVHALIWMGLVALGLALMVWQMARGHSNLWMLLRAGALALVTLYACCFVNFAGLIAAGNLKAAPGVKLDRKYLCGLEPMATAAIYTHGPGVVSLEGLGCKDLPETASWPEWGFRKARVTAYARAAKGTL